jgi:transposase-like protein
MGRCVRVAADEDDEVKEEAVEEAVEEEVAQAVVALRTDVNKNAMKETKGKQNTTSEWL